MGLPETNDVTSRLDKAEANCFSQKPIAVWGLSLNVGVTRRRRSFLDMAVGTEGRNESAGNTRNHGHLTDPERRTGASIAAFKQRLAVRSVTAKWSARRRARSQGLIKETDEKKKSSDRFRRTARAVMNLVKVCIACRKIMQAQVMREQWYAMADSIMSDGNDAPTHKRRVRPFITFVPNDNGELEQLTFDPCEYSRTSAAEQLLTDDLLEALKQPPGTRSQEQVNDLVKFLKVLSTDFFRFPLDIQRALCQDVSYAKYQRNRVILRSGLLADGLHIMLSGEAVAKINGKKRPKDLRVGDLFGMEELMCGSTRQVTVITKSPAEIISLHRLDYQRIFNMAKDSDDPRHLDICSKDIVLQHFPLNKLAENPGVWTVLSFKFGRLMVKDSNQTEWIYIIKSGEARVLKNLPTGQYNVKARRQKVRQMMEAESTFHRTRQMLQFESEKPYIRSKYSPKLYKPAKVRLVRSAPPACGRQEKNVSSRPLSKSKRLQEILGSPRSSRPATVPIPETNRLSVCDSEGKENTKDTGRDDSHETKPLKSYSSLNIPSQVDSTEESDIKLPEIIVGGSARRDSHVSHDNDVTNPKSAVYLKTGNRGQRRTSKPKTGEGDSSILIPPFVQLESLHPGQVFGFRACLAEEERGPSVSLVSGGCEAILVNKKFFMTHSDEAVCGLIRLKYKPFPSDEELIDRLDANLQWKEYKQKTMADQVQSLRERQTTWR